MKKLIVRDDLRQSPYEPAGLVRNLTSETVKNQGYGHFL
jgi:hypothetical protein